MDISRRVALGLLCVSGLGVSGGGGPARGEPSEPARPEGRPNVILIMADDLGYETIGANGGTSYRTPVLDRLAATGVRFEHCHVQPLCTPTRVQIMTGIYNVRNYITFGTIDPQVTTFGHLFRRAGYATGITGKWQLGRDPNLPRQLGFDEALLWQHTRRPPRYANPGLELNGVERDYHQGEYGPDLINQFARDFISRHQDEPFFLYYPMILTHGPYQPTPDSPDWDPKAIGEEVNINKAHFADMVAYMDKLIGKLLADLDTLGLRERTLLIFLGDNGTGAGTRSMMGEVEVRGGKGSTTAAGMRVPLIASWPGTLARGRVCSDLVDSTDFLPTLCEAAGITIPADLAIDGRSFLPQLRGEPGNPREWIYSWYSPRGEPLKEFAFDQRWKLYRSGEVFDLAEDPEERQPKAVGDLSREAAERIRVLGAALERYRDARPADLPRPGENAPDRSRGPKASR
jgi:arylsulfatase A